MDNNLLFVKNCSWDGNEDDPENQIPNPVEAYKFFGAGSVCSSISFADRFIQFLVPRIWYK